MEHRHGVHLVHRLTAHAEPSLRFSNGCAMGEANPFGRGRLIFWHARAEQTTLVVFPQLLDI